MKKTARVPRYGVIGLLASAAHAADIAGQWQVYTPPGYTKDQKYPVLYLLHGIGGGEGEAEAALALHEDNTVRSRACFRAGGSPLPRPAS